MFQFQFRSTGCFTFLYFVLPISNGFSFWFVRKTQFEIFMTIEKERMSGMRGQRKSENLLKRKANRDNEIEKPKYEGCYIK